MCKNGNENVSDTLEVGALVRLNSGGPVMTVEQVAPGYEYICSWFNGGQVSSYTFPCYCLEKVSRGEVDPWATGFPMASLSSFSCNNTDQGNTCRVLEDVQDRAARLGCPGDLGLTEFTDYLRGLYPEHYIINPNKEDANMCKNGDVFSSDHTKIAGMGRTNEDVNTNGSDALEVGDVVRLNSGRPVMTVEQIVPCDQCVCIWNLGGSVAKDTFHVSCLTKIDKSDTWSVGIPTPLMSAIEDYMVTQGD